MSFASAVFLWHFLPVVLATYSAPSPSRRNALPTAASLSSCAANRKLLWEREAYFGPENFCNELVLRELGQELKGPSR